MCAWVCPSVQQKSFIKGEENYVVESILFHDQIKDQIIIMKENKDYKENCSKTE